MMIKDDNNDRKNNNETDNIYNPYHATAPAAEDEPEIAVAAETETTATAVPLVPATPVPDAPITTTTTTTCITTDAAGGLLIPSILPASVSQQPIHVVLKSNLFMQASSSQPVVFAAGKDGNEPLPIRLQSHYQGKVNQLLVLDATTQQPRAVVRKNDPQNPDKFHLFGVFPIKDGQSHSITLKLANGLPTYPWGSLVNADGTLPYNSKRIYKFNTEHGTQMTCRKLSGGGGGGLFGLGRKGNKNKHQPVEFQVEVQSRQVQIMQRNVQMHHGGTHSIVRMHQDHDATAAADWHIEIPVHCAQDPTVMILVALMLDELNR